MTDSDIRAEGIRIEIGSIGIAGAPAAMRDGAAFGRTLDAALARALAQVGGAVGGRVDVDALTVRLRRGAGAREIAAEIAAAVVDATRKG